MTAAVLAILVRLPGTRFHPSWWIPAWIPLALRDQPPEIAGATGGFDHCGVAGRHRGGYPDGS